jgi:FKBP-type peptidyl-prolyl cis-trans isomerase FklB
MNIGKTLKRGSYEVDVDVLSTAIKDVMAGHDLKLTDAQAQETMQTFQREAKAKHDEEQKKLADKNKASGETFLAENKKKEGVKTLTVTLPDGKSAEMQYKVLTEGTGPLPSTNEVVTINYKGTTIDGKEFDSSTKRPQAAKIALNRDMLRGRNEALERMKVGSKWEVYLPASLAYGESGMGPVESGSTVIMELELLSIDTPQPLTSDIIRVPSAEELKRGSNVEVLKAEDVARMQNGAAGKK